ncbi:glycosyltransferase family 4 protein [Paraburkholderia sp. LEh10]|uniref:glycosyltransferase family 4 protein n=1 Tax=Paraburkholderia sp. LEh10 TaxID=2821353 RepID=UPI001AE1E5DC|nr:glycosyltransferase family 4 protein [Paraburkholderia sp. LEh10]MBP0594681.1 glycosyltransferase family 4 protein [Paraburkholderia sp. LEh10]
MTTKVHVHLFYGADPRFYRKGENIGCLYGYHHAESDEFQLTYSQDVKESRPVRLVRRALKAMLGFDLLHTLRNRDAILCSDVIWTHTEQEWLSVALLLLMSGRREAPPLLLAQSVWLLDKWRDYGLMRRWFYRKLVARADLLTTLARDNAQLCREFFGRDATQLFYGLNTRDFPVQPPQEWQPHTPLRIAAIGNDRDRDWETLVKAVGNDPRFAVRLATRRRIARSLRSLNVHVAPAAGLEKQRELYDWADVIVVPLRPNSHASGITVMLEAAAVGKPMVVTNVGGLQDYFSARAAAYVPPFDAGALRDALLGLATSPDKALQQAQAAATQLLSRDHTTQHYAQQHVKITRDLLRRRAQTMQAAQTAHTTQTTHTAQTTLRGQRQGDAAPQAKANANARARVPSQSRGGM